MKVLSNEFMQHIAEEDAWKKLTNEIHWSEAMLEKYEKKIDWKELSERRDILWTIPMIQKFRHRLNWDSLSGNISEESLTDECIATFAERWSWSELSRNSNLNLTDELLEKYADNLDWEIVIDRYRDNIFEGRGIDFYEKYKEHIPAAKLPSSSLWDEIVNQSKRQILNEITAH